ncbi:hypothetical protein LCGC14_3082060, partial [marine sediment metagenome]
MGAGATLGMTRAGVKYVATNPNALKWWQRLLRETAKDPAKFQKIEAALNTSAAAGGEAAFDAAMESGNPEIIEHAGWVRFGGEILSMGGVGLLKHYGTLMNNWKDAHLFKLTLTPKGQEEYANRIIGQWINELMEANPNSMRHIAQAENLMKQVPGLNIHLPQYLQSPEAQAAFNAVIRTGESPVATRFMLAQEAN